MATNLEEVSVDGSGFGNIKCNQSTFKPGNSKTNTFNSSVGDHGNTMHYGAILQLSDMLNQNMNMENVADLKDILRTFGPMHSRGPPTIPVNDLRGEEASKYSREECALRRSLTALYRLIDIRGWTHSIYNHISARCTDNPDQFLINPFGLLYHEIQASTLVKIDTEGNVVQQGSTVLGVNKAAWTLHSALHTARRDVNCIIHVHVPDVIAVSCIRAGLLPVSSEANELLMNSGVCYHDYHGILVDETERASLQSDLGPKAKILFLRNHGVAVAASSIPEAWYLIKRVVAACQTQMRMLQLSGKANMLTELKECAANMMNQISNHTESPSVQENSNGIDSPNQSFLANGKPCSEAGDMTLSPEDLEFEAEMRVLDSAGFRTGHVYRQPNLLRHAQVTSAWAGDTLGDTHQMTGAELLSTDFSANECSAMDDVTAAEAAGAQQVAKIADHVKANRQKNAQRQQWLSRANEPRDNEIDISRESNKIDVLTPINKSATLPANVQHLTSPTNAHSNTLQSTDGHSLTEGDAVKGQTKKKSRKIGSFRIPSFSRKKKT